MKAKLKRTGQVIDVVPYSQMSDCNDAYMEIDSNEIWYASELDFTLSEPEEEVTIEGRAERTIDGKLRLFVGYINYVYIPADCNIAGEVTITIKPKKK